MLVLMHGTHSLVIQSELLKSPRPYNKTNDQYLCVNKGGHGALLQINGERYYNFGYLIKLVDIVGARF